MLPFELLQMLWHMKMKMNYQSPRCSGPGNNKLLAKKKEKKVRSLTRSLVFFLGTKIQLHKGMLEVHLLWEPLWTCLILE